MKQIVKQYKVLKGSLMRLVTYAPSGSAQILLYSQSGKITLELTTSATMIWGSGARRYARTTASTVTMSRICNAGGTYLGVY